MADPELGTKQVCPNCESKFYDLNKRPAVCPKCGHSFDPADETAQAMKTKVRSKAAKASVPEDDEDDLEDEDAVVATATAEDDEDSGHEDEARELGGDENEVVLEMNDTDSDDEAPGKVPSGFSEDGVDDDDDEDDLGLDDEFDLGDDDVDIDDDNTLGEPDAGDMDPEEDDK